VTSRRRPRRQQQQRRRKKKKKVKKIVVILRRGDLKEKGRTTGRIICIPKDSNRTMNAVQQMMTLKRAQMLIFTATPAPLLAT
jgi:hypothetical protein